MKTRAFDNFEEMDLEIKENQSGQPPPLPLPPTKAIFLKLKMSSQSITPYIGRFPSNKDTHWLIFY